VSVASLRALQTALGDDPEVDELVAVLQQESEECAVLWDAHEVGTRSGATKRFLHPLAGTLELQCQILTAENATERLVVFVPSPGSDDERRLASLTAPDHSTGGNRAPAATASPLSHTST
jgi:hypothetical protein